MEWNGLDWNMVENLRSFREPPKRSRYQEKECNLQGVHFHVNIMCVFVCVYMDWTCRRYKMLDNMQLFFHIQPRFVSSTNFMQFFLLFFLLFATIVLTLVVCIWLFMERAHFDRLPHQIKQQPMTGEATKKTHRYSNCIICKDQTVQPLSMCIKSVCRCPRTQTKSDKSVQFY